VKAACRLACAAALALPLLLLSGCLSTMRRLPVPKGPAVVQTATPEELVNRLNQRFASLESLTARVDLQASVLKSKEGVATDYTSVPGLIFMRKPEMLRVYGMVPVIRTRLFDMVSDGKEFTLYIPSKNKAMRGSNAVRKRSANQLENLRPGFFLDALVVRGLEPNDLYSVTADEDMVEDAAKKHLSSVPEYILSIYRRKPDSQKLAPVRVVHFHREDLLPYQQDLYDSEGNLETEVFYAQFGEFGTSKYPSVVTIKRPLEDIRIVLTVQDVKENQDPPLTDDQFQINIPEGTEIQKLE
jgi:outer membrane lipoprotein-sorting protein